MIRRRAVEPAGRRAPREVKILIRGVWFIRFTNTAMNLSLALHSDFAVPAESERGCTYRGFAAVACGERPPFENLQARCLAPRGCTASERRTADTASRQPAPIRSSCRPRGRAGAMLRGRAGSRRRSNARHRGCRISRCDNLPYRRRPGPVRPAGPATQKMFRALPGQSSARPPVIATVTAQSARARRREIASLRSQ
jgi:hypothetical protein